MLLFHNPIDKGGALCVGPESAGADPGPICYGNGTMVTVTDANLLLGRLSVNHFLGGNMKLYPNRINQYIKPIAKHLKMNATDVAEGIVNIANSNMERAIKVVSVERGFDIREFTLVSFGGAGGLHACELAKNLLIRNVLIPKNAGTLSALGMAASDIIKDYSISLLMNVNRDDYNKLLNLAKPLVSDAINDISAEGCKKDKVITKLSVDMRYTGQSFELDIPLKKDFFNRFHQLHKRSYGYAKKDYDVEVVNLRVRGIGKRSKTSIKKNPKGKSSLSSAIVTKVQSYFRNKSVELEVYDRDRLPIGSTIKDPALIVEKTATTFIPPDYVCMVDEYENLIIEY